MNESKIYISVDSRSPKATVKRYGYVLECVVAGEERTREGFGRIMGTYNRAVLKALGEALGRFKKACRITIHVEDAFTLNMLENNLTAWAENGFLSSKGQPVANQEEWIHIWEKSRQHILLTKHGKHPYSNWLLEEIKKRKEQNNV